MWRGSSHLCVCHVYMESFNCWIQADRKCTNFFVSNNILQLLVLHVILPQMCATEEYRHWMLFCTQTSSATSMSYRNCLVRYGNISAWPRCCDKLMTVASSSHVYYYYHLIKTNHWCGDDKSWKWVVSRAQPFSTFPPGCGRVWWHCISWLITQKCNCITAVHVATMLL